MRICLIAGTISSAARVVVELVLIDDDVDEVLVELVLVDVEVDNEVEVELVDWLVEVEDEVLLVDVDLDVEVDEVDIEVEVLDEVELLVELVDEEVELVDVVIDTDVLVEDVLRLVELDVELVDVDVLDDVLELVDVLVPPAPSEKVAIAISPLVVPPLIVIVPVCVPVEDTILSSTPRLPVVVPLFWIKCP